MIRIQNIANQTLELEPDVNIEFEFNNWLLADSDDLPGSFSYPINFPLSDNNKKFIGHTHLPESRPVDVPVTVWINGVILRKSALSFKIDNSSGSGYLKVDAGEIADKIRGRYLHECFKESYYFGSTLANLKLLMKASAAAEPGAYPFAFFPVYNFGLAPEPKDMEDVPGYIQYTYVNAWDGSNFIVTKNRHFTPFIYLTHLIEKICAFFGFTATGSFLQLPEIRRLTIYNTQTLPYDGLGVSEGIRQNLGMHVPYMQISDFFKALRNDYGVGIYFDTSRLECSFEMYDTVRDSSSNYKDLTAYLLAGYNNEVPDDKGFKLVSYKDDADYNYKTYEPVSYSIRAGHKEVKSNIGTLLMFRGANPENGHQWQVPSARQPGNLFNIIFQYQTGFFNRVVKHKNDFGLRLISYRGMQQDGSGALYPYGSSVSKSFDQTRIGQWSLDPKQSDSFFYKVTVPFYNFLAYARRLRFSFLLPVSLSRSLKLQDVYAIKGQNSVMIRCMMERLNISIPGKSGKVLAKGSMYVLIPADASPNVVQNEQFFIELEMTFQYTEVIGDRTIAYADFKILVYADAAKTTPGNPTNLSVLYESYQLTTPAGESTTSSMNSFSLVMSGNEYDLIKVVISDQGPEEDIFMEYSLAFSADYTIL